MLTDDLKKRGENGLENLKASGANQCQVGIQLAERARTAAASTSKLLPLKPSFNYYLRNLLKLISAFGTSAKTQIFAQEEETAATARGALTISGV
ncbi:hypothetical protein EVAR_40001_1 [Eumeta japonica]|uniref:Uncharacterized protein n=1 Tax=Eumeta variegata TaxID=151549 RepID=A0A4C1ZPN0_EUMVA|nr:hypothetical protein EVAR_40001_1 [Eumeta japonica]